MLPYFFGTPTAFRDSTAPGANTAIQVFAPAANVRGAWLINAWSYHRVAAGTVPFEELTWGALAPVASNDRNTIIMTTNVTLVEIAGQDKGNFHQDIPYFIPAGNGLWFFVTIAQTSGFRGAQYALLAP